MSLIRLFGAILALCQLTALYGHAQQYAFQEDSDTEGLNSLTINCLLQDHTGFVWVCTENGLYQFDGSTYTRTGADQGLLDSYIQSIHEDADGELWVGTSTRLYHGDGHHFSAVGPDSAALTSSQGQQLASLGPDHVLAVSHHHLVQLARASAGGTWNIEPFPYQAALDSQPELANINSVFTDSGGAVWAGCGNSICQFSGGALKVWGPMEGVVADTWAWFLQDSAGRTWARGYHHVLELRPHASQFVNEDIPSAPVTFSTPLVPIVEDAQHRILTRTDRGLAIWTQGKWQALGAINGLNVPGILSLMVDRDGIVWLGTYGKGVERWLGNGNWETWASGQGLDGNLVWSLVRDDKGALWAATEHGIATTDRAGKTFMPWHPNAKVPRGQVISVQKAHDRSLWYSSTSGELLRYSADHAAFQSWKMPTGMRWLWKNAANQMWGLTNSGLYVFDETTNQITKVHNSAVRDQSFFDVCEDSGHTLWFASNGGIVHFSGGMWHTIAVSGRHVSDGFGNVACARDGTLWLGGASTGVEHVRVQGNVAVSADPQPPPEFKTVEPMFLHQDNRGWLWIGSGSGVYVFNGERWRHLTKNDGLVWNDCNEGSFLEDTDGSVWIGTSNGLSHLLHPEEIFDQKPLQVVVTSAQLGEQSISIGSPASIAWTREPLRVHVVSSPLEDQPSTVYRYRLGGLEKGWSTTRSHDLRYSSLPDGNYRLELYAEDTESGIRSPLTVVSFRIRPPWWKGLYFDLSVGLAILFLVILALRYRERELVAGHARLEALVRERTEQLELEKKQLTEAREALHEQASRDPLTGLLNRRAIYDVLSREMARIKRDRSALTAVMIDLDHFKVINDTHGHMVGDEVLRKISDRLTEAIRPYDAISRYGGEEFLLIMPDINASRERDRLLMVHEAICGQLVEVAGKQIIVTCSFGVSVLFSDERMSVEQFIDRADRALYEAKRLGRNRIAYDIASHFV